MGRISLTRSVKNSEGVSLTKVRFLRTVHDAANKCFRIYYCDETDDPNDTPNYKSHLVLDVPERIFLSDKIKLPKTTGYTDYMDGSPDLNDESTMLRKLQADRVVGAGSIS